MNLMYIAALVAVCSAAKLDRTYLPPATAKTSGGSSGDLFTPNLRDSFQPGRSGLPKGAEENEFDGVVVEAAAPGTRVSNLGESGLGGSRTSYGSTHSKVGEAAFKTINHQVPVIDGQSVQVTVDSQTSHSFHQSAPSDFIRPRPQSAIERASSTVRFENNIGSQAYNYAFETENGITAVENGVAINGVQAEGGFSYTGDDGKFYKITYTAGEGGYQPKGDHLPTPPPIPDEILKSLEQNAKEAAAGLEDDGSYDAAKYNTEDDYTKTDSSNSGQLAFGKKPELNGDVRETFITQNNQPFVFSTNNNHKDVTLAHRFSEQRPSVGNSFEPTHIGTGSNEFDSDSQKFNFEQQGSETSKLGTPQISHTGSDATTAQFGLSESDKKANTNIQDVESELDDFSRPIYFGTTQFNQNSNNGFGIEQSYLPPSNNFVLNQQTGDNSNFATSVHSAVPFDKESQNIPENLNSELKNTNNFNEQKINFALDSQISPYGNKFTNSIDYNRMLDVPQYISTLPSIHSTLQPSLELTTPLEYFSNLNKHATFSSQNQNQRGSSFTTQASFSPLPTSEFQSNEGAHSGISKTNSDGKMQLNQQNYNVPKQNLIDNSKYNPRPDQPYYYDSPVKFFNPYNRPTTPTFEPSKNAESFNNRIPTKYPSPPTVLPTFSNSYPKKTMHSPYSATSQVFPFVTQNQGNSATTKYPQPPSLGQIIPTPTSPTVINDENIFTQHSDITHASVSAFPTISVPKYSSNYDTQRTETIDQNVTPKSETNNKPERVDVTVLNVPSFNNVAPQIRPSQQYEGEVYEYKKPTETLSTSAESGELIQQDFSQFGQKLQTTSIQSSTPQLEQTQKENEFNKGDQGVQPSQESLSLAGTKPLSLGSLPFSESMNDGFSDNNKKSKGPFGDTYSTGLQELTQSSRIQSGAFTEAQTTTDYEVPFEFSSRIKPCCQGPRKSSMSETPGRLTENDFKNLAPFGLQNTNLRPTFESGSPSRQSTGLQGQKELQSAQKTSQSLFIAAGEEFNGPRQPPSFDEASGYHY